MYGSSPTVTTDSVFSTGVVDALGDCAVAILDITNVFIHAQNDEKILMLLRSRLA